MTCPYSPETLALYVGGDLPQPRHLEVMAHVGACDDCSDLCERFSESRSLLRSLSQERLDQAELTRARMHVIALIEGERDKPGWALRAERMVISGFRGQRFAVAGIATVLVGAVVVYGVLGHFGSGAGSISEPLPIAVQPQADTVPSAIPAREEVPETGGAAVGPVAVVASVALEVPDENFSSEVPVEVPDGAPTAEAPGPEPEQVLVRFTTENPDLLIYWVIEADGGGA